MSTYWISVCAEDQSELPDRFIFFQEVLAYGQAFGDPCGEATFQHPDVANVSTPERHGHTRASELVR